MPSPPVPVTYKQHTKSLVGISIAAWVSCMLWFAAMPSPASEPHKQVLHRVDMQVAGSSCATCLIRLEKKLKAEKGVLKVVVSIFKPFKSAVIYDETQTNWQTINKVLEGEKVTAADFKDTPINDVPLVLEPK